MVNKRVCFLFSDLTGKTRREEEDPAKSSSEVKNKFIKSYRSYMKMHFHCSTQFVS